MNGRAYGTVRTNVRTVSSLASSKIKEVDRTYRSTDRSRRAILDHLNIASRRYRRSSVSSLLLYLSTMTTTMLRRSLFLTSTTKKKLFHRFFSTAADYPHHDHDHYDVLIVGGGVVGSALASCLQVAETPRVKVGVIERSNGPTATTSSTTTTTTTAIPHPRAYALSPKSLKLLGIDDNDKNNNTTTVKRGTYRTMQVWEQDSPSLLVFTEGDLVDNEENQSGLGAVVEDQALVRYLWNELEKEDHSQTTTLFRNATINDIQQNDNAGLVQVQLTQDGSQQQRLSTKLLVAADGANSFVRKHHASNFPWEGFDYDRSALTCTLKLQSKMPPRAFQRFLTHGPMALLPTHDADYATVVWSTTPEQANYYYSGQQEATINQELVDTINRTLQQGPERIPELFPTSPSQSSVLLSNLAYGTNKLLETVHYGLTMAHWRDYQESFVAPPVVDSVAGPKFTFPLSCRHSSFYYHNRIVLCGDSAHTIHPMAGQGLNLGLRDVQVLSESIHRAVSAGMELSTFIQSDYAIPQHRFNAAAQTSIHALHQAYNNRSTVLQHGKSLGMHAVNMVGPVRRQLAAIATGSI
jgi:ubiquinone biosynthesis monooxygenase Coq6